ncbi:MAG: acyltransferase [Acidobacteria bacterium]|nr:acyltransferase [Acidobacteriota bacterium]
MFIALYRLLVRVQVKLFSLLVAGAFAEFGRRSVLQLPVRISGEDRVAVGSSVYVGSGCWIQCLPDGDSRSVAISLGNGVSIAGGCVISAVRSVTLEENVLLARNVYIADHMHSYRDKSLPVLAQGVERVSPVLIKRGAWLGQNVVVCPGVTIGCGSVVGANSVVTQDVGDYSVAVGAPARVVKSF